MTTDIHPAIVGLNESGENHGNDGAAPLDDLDPCRLNHIRSSNNIRSMFHRSVDPGQLAEDLAKRLDQASHKLVDKLFAYLSSFPSEEVDRRTPCGLELPAFAIGWLSTQMFPKTNEADAAVESPSESAWLGASMRDRLALLKYLIPRVTSLRVTLEQWPPISQQKKLSPRSTDFTGRDLDLSNISVHSGVTIESTYHETTNPSIQSFLLFYNQIQNKPRVDMLVFPNLTVLYLDRIPPEWVTNLYTLHKTIRLIRSEKACIYDMTTFLFGVDGNNQDIESRRHVNLPKLEFLKVNYASIGEMSCLRGKRSSILGEEVLLPPPLSRLPKLRSLSLAYNEIRRVKTALAGLIHLPNLVRLDLSYNQIKSMRGADGMLGNVKVLVLTGNLLTNVDGLVKLYGLETLHLDGNKINDVSSVAGIGNLPNLMNISLKGNPFTYKDPLIYRIKVLDFFKSTRFYSLLPGATFRALLHILPLVDGKSATKRELVALKSLSFRQASTLASASIDDSVASQPIESEIASNGIVGQSLNVISSTRKVTRKVRRANPVVIQKEMPHAVSKKSVTEQNLTFPTVNFSAKDILVSITLRRDRKGSEHDEERSDFTERKSERTDTMVHPLTNDLCEEENRLRELSDLAKFPQNVENDEAMFFGNVNTNLLDNYSSASYVVPPMIPTSSSPVSVTCKAESDFALDSILPLSDIQAHSPSSLNPNLQSLSYAKKSLHNEVLLPVNPFEESYPKERPIRKTKDQSTSWRVQIPEILPKSSVHFPDGVWEDSESLGSSIGTGPRCNGFLESDAKYVEEEKNSVYDGPEGYKKLSINVNLELYFRLFVFPSSSGHIHGGCDSTEDQLGLQFGNSPRIQLRPVDRIVACSRMRAVAEAAKILSVKETFKKVWQEEIIACGKSAIRRVAPHKKLRRGFHGDPIFKNGSISFVMECRKIIVCTTDAAIYLIPDFDPVSMKSINASTERKFPTPIPQEALFQNGVWPHALARLPIETLKRITIGFSFQRLILHFSSSSELESSVIGSSLTFILATSNRVATVKLLQHFQDVKQSTDYLSEERNNELLIDNEDKQVLEALSEAVSPCTVDIVIHYQVLQQRWKHGDRGTVRRACVITDDNIFLLDEDYAGDGAESSEDERQSLGEVRFTLIDSAKLIDVVEIQAATVDPQEITIVIRPQSSFQRNHYWRLNCHDSNGAERLVEDVRKAMLSIGGDQDL
jgi:hypothetical protein